MIINAIKALNKIQQGNNQKEHNEVITGTRSTYGFFPNIAQVKKAKDISITAKMTPLGQAVNFNKQSLQAPLSEEELLNRVVALFDWRQTPMHLADPDSVNTSFQSMGMNTPLAKGSNIFNTHLMFPARQNLKVGIAFSGQAIQDEHKGLMRKMQSNYLDHLNKEDKKLSLMNKFMKVLKASGYNFLRADEVIEIEAAAGRMMIPGGCPNRQGLDVTLQACSRDDLVEIVRRINLGHDIAGVPLDENCRDKLIEFVLDRAEKAWPAMMGYWGSYKLETTIAMAFLNAAKDPKQIEHKYDNLAGWLLHTGKAMSEQMSLEFGDVLAEHGASMNP